jgi:hypothetical protein
LTVEALLCVKQKVDTDDDVLLNCEQTKVSAKLDGIANTVIAHTAA